MSTYLEIGPGRGDFLFHLATENPLHKMIAVEYKAKRFEKLVKRVEQRGLNNIQLYLGDARVVLPQEFSNESFDAIFILFSDPWPKRRHARNRLFQDAFVQELARILRPEGKVFIAHDDPSYVSQIQDVFKNFVPIFAFSEEGTDFPTFYSDKWKKEGRTIFSFSYHKIVCPSERDYLSIPCVLPTNQNN